MRKTLGVVIAVAAVFLAAHHSICWAEGEGLSSSQKNALKQIQTLLLTLQPTTTPTPVITPSVMLTLTAVSWKYSQPQGGADLLGDQKQSSQTLPDQKQESQIVPEQKPEAFTLPSAKDENLPAPIAVAESKTANLPDAPIPIKEHFANLDNWVVQTPNNDMVRRTRYGIVEDGEGTCLRAESDASGTTLAYRGTFNVNRFPVLKWRWKVGDIVKGADVKDSEKDDAPWRIMLAFQYTPGKGTFMDSMVYELGKLISGAYAPDSEMYYVWASQDYKETVVKSKREEKTMLYLLEKGPAKVGQWVDEKVNIVEDFQKAFGSAPPAIVSLSLINDTGKTEGHVVSYLKYIESSEP